MKYKIRFNCSGYTDVVVEAKNKKEAESEALRVAKDCHNGGHQFGEFLEVEDGDEVQN